MKLFVFSAYWYFAVDYDSRMDGRMAGVGLRPEDIWGHGSFDNMMEEEYQCKRMDSYF